MRCDGGSRNGTKKILWGIDDREVVTMEELLSTIFLGSGWGGVVISKDEVES